MRKLGGLNSATFINAENTEEITRILARAYGYNPDDSDSLEEFKEFCFSK